VFCCIIEGKCNLIKPIIMVAIKPDYQLFRYPRARPLRGSDFVRNAPRPPGYRKTKDLGALHLQIAKQFMQLLPPSVRSLRAIARNPLPTLPTGEGY